MNIKENMDFLDGWCLGWKEAKEHSALMMRQAEAEKAPTEEQQHKTQESDPSCETPLAEGFLNFFSYIADHIRELERKGYL